MSPAGARVAAVVPAKDEQRRITATLRALAGVPGVDLVVVVDDGSNDRTADVAAQAGAIVVRHQRNRGKGSAMTTGAREVARLDAAEGGREPHLLLFADADLEASAAGLAPLPGPVAAGTADMAVAVLPPQQRTGGGFGLVVRTARFGIRRLTGWTPTQPLSGMRCLTREAFEAASPLAAGWGVEVGLTVDVLRAGLRVTEVPCSLQHRVTGRDWRGQVHRARQLRDVSRALAARAVPAAARALPRRRR